MLADTLRDRVIFCILVPYSTAAPPPLATAATIPEVCCSISVGHQCKLANFGVYEVKVDAMNEDLKVLLHQWQCAALVSDFESKYYFPDDKTCASQI